MFVSMMAPTTQSGNTAKAKAGFGNSRLSRSSRESSSNSMDLWNIAPPVVAKPKPRPPVAKPVSTLESTLSRGTMGNRKKKNTGADDWTAFLGSADLSPICCTSSLVDAAIRQRSCGVRFCPCRYFKIMFPHAVMQVAPLLRLRVIPYGSIFLVVQTVKCSRDARVELLECGAVTQVLGVTQQVADIGARTPVIAQAAGSVTN
eukprot:IDg15547t1